MPKPKWINEEGTTKMNQEDEPEEWGGEYRDPDYVEGSNPMDNDEVTLHHQWQQSRVEREEE
jgi:hypothetical protein